VVHHRRVVRSVHRTAAAPPRPGARRAVIVPDRSVGMLLQLLAMDYDESAQKAIGEPLPAS
jgi:hypothetical protein